MASPRCTAPPPTSASRATRWAAAWAGSPAATGCSATTCSPPSWSPPPARSSARTRRPTPSCSGRCAAAADRSASSPRSRSRCCRSRWSTRACSRGTPSTPGPCSPAGASGPPTRPTRPRPPPARPPPLALPPPRTLRGRRLVTIDGAIAGDDAHARELLRGLRALRPEIDSFGQRSAATLLRRIGDFDRAAPVVSDHLVLDTLDAERHRRARRRHRRGPRPALDRAAPARRRALPPGARRRRARRGRRRRRPLRRRAPPRTTPTARRSRSSSATSARRWHRGPRRPRA